LFLPLPKKHFLLRGTYARTINPKAKFWKSSCEDFLSFLQTSQSCKRLLLRFASDCQRLAYRAGTVGRVLRRNARQAERRRFGSGYFCVSHDEPNGGVGRSAR